MKHLMLVVLSFLLMAGVGYAQEPKADASKAGKKETVSIAVESIQCGMCRKTVEKALKKVNGVESAKVDLDTKTATVTFLPAKASLKDLESAITKVGYSANDRQPDAEAYEKLDDCCKLPEE